MTAPQRVVHLHIGAPKTGTTLLQDVLFANQRTLRDHAVLVPGRHRQSHFHATVDLLGREWGGVEDTARGTFDELIAEIQQWPHAVVVSNENLALADEAPIERLRAALPDDDLRIVYSARDLVRQIPAAWQEQVKHSYTKDFGAFVRSLRESPDAAGARQFWTRQSWPDVIERWSKGLNGAPATVVTVPASGQDPALLLPRFCAALELNEAWLLERSARTNPSLGPRETTLLRLVQIELDARGTAASVRRTSVRGAMVGRWWASRPTEGRVALPAEALDWAQRLSLEWVTRLEQQGVRVVGDLGDLVPASGDVSGAVDPDQAGPDELLTLAVRTIADALEEQADLVGERRLITRARDDLRTEADRLAIERDEARDRVVELERTHWQAAKQALVARAATNKALGFGYTAYRRARGR